jgi:hypothetical protein
MRVILDTSVLVAGLRSQLGASAVLLREVARGKLELVARIDRRDFEKAAARFGIAVHSPAEILHRIKPEGGQK